MAKRHSFLVIFTAMSIRYLLCLLMVSFTLAGNAQTKKKVATKKAVTKKVPAKAKPYFVVLEAFNQNILPVKAHTTPTTGEHFIIVWEAPKYPETFFWRKDSSVWLPCKIMKAHKVVCKSPDFPEGMEYSISHVKGDDIHPGDTLELTPMLRGKFPIPTEIPKYAKNTLFFRAGKSPWLSLPVKEIGTKPDITMPY